MIKIETSHLVDAQRHLIVGRRSLKGDSLSVFEMLEFSVGKRFDLSQILATVRRPHTTALATSKFCPNSSHLDRQKSTERTEANSHSRPFNFSACTYFSFSFVRH
jgi:hypothetical protein